MCRGHAKTVCVILGANPAKWDRFSLCRPHRRSDALLCLRRELGKGRGGCLLRGRLRVCRDERVRLFRVHCCYL